MVTATAIPGALPGMAPAAALPGEIDRYLDAALDCIVRFGISHTSVPDIARAAGVSRATIYRQIGTMETTVRLLLAREVDRLLALLAEPIDVRSGPEAVVEAIARITEYTAAHGAWQKVLRDEPEVLGPHLVASLGEVITRVGDVVVPWLEAAADLGMIERLDTVVLADWLVRITVSIVVTPPPGAVRDFLRPILLPVLAPRRPVRRDRR